MAGSSPAKTKSERRFFSLVAAGVSRTASARLVDRRGTLSQVEKPVSGYLSVIGFCFPVSQQTCEKNQFTNYYNDNDRSMPNSDPRIFGVSLPFPCRAFDSAGESRARF
jgi:hypothetical protein